MEDMDEDMNNKIENHTGKGGYYGIFNENKAITARKQYLK